jgi:hypothetical protein
MGEDSIPLIEENLNVSDRLDRRKAGEVWQAILIEISRDDRTGPADLVIRRRQEGLSERADAGK